MKKVFILFIIYFFCTHSIFSQNINGLYLLSLKEFNQYGKTIIGFRDSSFVLLGIKPSPTPRATNFEISAYGDGKYAKFNDSLILSILNEHEYLTCCINDSISCLFSTNIYNRKIRIKLILKSNITNYHSQSLCIYTSHDNINFKIKNDTNIFFIPSDVNVKSISIRSIGYEERLLPFDCHFNDFIYYMGPIINTGTCISNK